MKFCIIRIADNSALQVITLMIFERILSSFDHSFG